MATKKTVSMSGSVRTTVKSSTSKPAAKASKQKTPNKKR